MTLLKTLESKVLTEREPITSAEALAILQLPDEQVQPLVELAHQVRLDGVGPEVEVESIISAKTGGCPEDCAFCSQSRHWPGPVRAQPFLNIDEIVEAAVRSRETGATEFCIVLAVRGPDDRVMSQVLSAVDAIHAATDIQVACSLGILDTEQTRQLLEAGVHRYNHNLETAKSFFPQIVTTHTWEERFETCELVRDAGMELCSGGILGMGETLEQRVEFAMQLRELSPCEIPLNFLNPRPDTPLADRMVVAPLDAIRAIAMFRLVFPNAILRYAGGREITLGELQPLGMLAGINGIIVGNYLTTLGRSSDEDFAMLAELGMPVKALGI